MQGNWRDRPEVFVAATPLPATIACLDAFLPAAHNPHRPGERAALRISHDRDIYADLASSSKWPESQVDSELKYRRNTQLSPAKNRSARVLQGANGQRA